ncbi:hypothetical protein B481_0969 [Planococcus halocryophilus Or1]|nr:hypothetical protein B481_0969 [Planococcus halocryophilus Or1]
MVTAIALPVLKLPFCHVFDIHGYGKTAKYLFPGKYILV